MIVLPGHPYRYVHHAVMERARMDHLRWARDDGGHRLDLFGRSLGRTRIHTRLLSRARLVDCELLGCSLVSCRIRGGEWVRVDVSRLTAVQPVRAGALGLQLQAARGISLDG